MRQVLLATTFVLASYFAQAAESSDPLKDAPATYRDAVMEAMRTFTAHDYAKAKEQVQKADAGYQQTPVSLNMLGAIAIEQKNFDEGQKLCLEALKKDPKYFPAQFNLAEIPFVQGKYAEARGMFEKLQQDQPKDDLVRFRIFLTYLLEKNDAEAKKRLDEIPLINDTPISFYANAAWQFAHGNEARGKDWIGSALRSFPPVQQINFIEVFYDLGWLPRQAPETMGKKEPQLQVEKEINH
jgi:tetratricopeptide (TPR) repeat protein